MTSGGFWWPLMASDCLPHQVRPAGPRRDHDAVLAPWGLPRARTLLFARRSRLVRATHRALSLDARDGSHHPRVRCGAADGLRRGSMARWDRRMHAAWPVGTHACMRRLGRHGPLGPSHACGMARWDPCMHAKVGTAWPVGTVACTQHGLALKWALGGARDGIGHGARGTALCRARGV